MKKIDITKRDIKFFFLGVLVMFIFEMIYNWQDVKKGFHEGWDAGRKTSFHETQK